MSKNKCVLITLILSHDLYVICGIMLLILMLRVYLYIYLFVFFNQNRMCIWF